ncbi:hypothetical protein KFK09_001208 [Dendrobium nobile]|uniref:Uncharacterized protein n=1 Tax=Dendrobium nobile TaxID=94219 RepID=A0A8T3C466_DENNO|nr:hypothetical protein KFK09_001208 [Dendrobium nobile]
MGFAPNSPKKKTRGIGFARTKLADSQSVLGLRTGFVGQVRSQGGGSSVAWIARLSVDGRSWSNVGIARVRCGRCGRSSNGSYVRQSWVWSRDS